MKMPLGRLNCVHCSRKLPSRSKIWIRLLLRSPTNRRPLRVERERVRLIEFAGPGAGLAPSLDRGVPSFENFRISDAPWPCPCETKMSPLPATIDVVRLEEVLRVDASARLAERQQQLAVRAELEHLMAFGRAAAWPTDRPRAGAGAAGCAAREPRQARRARDAARCPDSPSPRRCRRDPRRCRAGRRAARRRSSSPACRTHRSGEWDRPSANRGTRCCRRTARRPRRSCRRDRRRQRSTTPTSVPREAVPSSRRCDRDWAHR